MNQRLLQHLIGWLIFLAYEFYTSLREYDAIEFDSFLIILTNNLVLVAAFYIVYFKLAPWLFKSFHWFKFLGVIIAGVFSYIAIRYFIQEMLFDWLFGFTNYYIESLTFYISDNIWRGSIPVVAGLVVFMVERKVQNDKLRLQLEREKIAAEVSFLRTQMNPHFLFNTLSFLHSEAYLVDPKLADTVLKLSDVLRYSVESSTKEKVPIQKEIDLLKNYIGIIEKRFEHKCFIEMKVLGQHFNQEIEPLLLIPFLENAIKHGLISDPQQPVKMAINILENELIFTCINKINQKHKDPGSGVGIANIRQRLELLYPENHSLELESTETIYKVKLMLRL